ncbi:MAG: hypothetical protein D6694_09245 [Gammaproteobacteria bacterium]|nr:MAG: hypothetical protein D6694_09245 [Gammaproteobacteria bacterium]
MRGRSPLPTPEIEAIIDAWISGAYQRAIALTNLWQYRHEKRVCKGINPDGSPCTHVLARQAKGDYCTRHRHQNPKVKEVVRKAKAKKKSSRSSLRSPKPA